MYAYEDFAVEITPTADAYSLRASALGEVARAQATFSVPPLELQNLLQAVEIASLRSGRGRRRVHSQAEQQLLELGRLLFEFLFTAEIRTLYEQSRREASQQGRGLRLKLSINDPALARLPWEFLYDSRDGEFVTLSRSTPIVRYLEVRTPDQPLHVQAPLRILGMIASPKDWEPLDVAQEKARLQAGLAPLIQRGLAELVWLDGQTWRDLLGAMRSGPWHIFHFIGHGGYDSARGEGMVLLADEEGRTAPLHATELARLLADHPSLRFVFLNACEGASGSDADGFASAAATLVRRGVAAVLAMQYDISDRAAIEFARSFYESLADGLPVDAAVTDARKAVSLAASGSPEWGTPVLFMQTADGRLFEVATDATRPGAEAGSAEADGAEADGAEADETDDASDGAPDDQPGGGLRLWPPNLWGGLLAAGVLALLLLVLWQAQLFPPRVQPPDQPTEQSASQTPPPAAGIAPSPQANTSATPVPGSAAPGETVAQAVLLQSSLDSLEAISAPAAGIGGFAVLDDEQFVPGVQGNGIAFDGRRPFIRFPLAQGQQRNLSLEAGSLEISYRPDYDYRETLPTRNTHILFVVGDVYNPPHFVLDFGDRVRLEYLVDFDERYFAQGNATGLWTAGEWIRVRAEWDRSQPDDPLRIFIDGQRIDTDRSGGSWPLPAAHQMNDLYIGAANANGDLDITGAIDGLIVRGPDAGASAVQVPTATPTPQPTPAPQPTPTATLLPVSGWARLGSAGPELDGWVRALAVDGETVYIGGSFDAPFEGLLTWDRRTGAWGTLGSGVQGTVQSLLVAGDDLYVGGEFTVRDAEGEVIARHIARWDGAAWHGLGGGLSGINRSSVADGVAALAVDATGNLYVGGFLSGGVQSDGSFVSSRGILGWDGARWFALGGDEGNSGLVRYSGDSNPAMVFALAVVGDYLYAGGHFASLWDRNGGEFPGAANFARFDTTAKEWEGLGSVRDSFSPDSNGGIGVHAIAFDGTDIYIAGRFTRIDCSRVETDCDPLGDDESLSAELLARFNPDRNAWQTVCCIDSRIGNSNSAFVRALALRPAGGLFVGGRFAPADSRDLQNIAFFDSGSWQALGEGTDGAVRALAAVGGEVYVGGEFASAGALSVPYLARWGEPNSAEALERGEYEQAIGHLNGALGLGVEKNFQLLLALSKAQRNVGDGDNRVKE